MVLCSIDYKILGEIVNGLFGTIVYNIFETTNEVFDAGFYGILYSKNEWDQIIM